MVPKIHSGQKHILAPATLDEVEVGDIVYAKVHGRFYTHLVKAKDPVKGVMIGNNHGHNNGWSKAVFGRVIKVLKDGEDNDKT